MTEKLKGSAILAGGLHPPCDGHDGVAILARLKFFRRRNPDRLSLDAGKQFPPVQGLRGRNKTARFFPNRDGFSSRQQAAAPLVVVEMPDPIKAPGQILQGIAEMGLLPVQNPAYR